MFGVAALVALAVLATSMVISASAAQESTFTAAEYPAFVSGGPTETKSIGIGFEGGQTAECEFAGFAGQITAATSELKVSPGFGGCTAFGSTEASVEAGGCALVFHPGSGSGDEFTGTIDIACPPGEAITVKGGNCEVQIGSQTGLGPVGYDRETAAEPADVEASFSMSPTSGFAYTKTAAGSGCPLAGTGAKSDGVFTGASKITAGNTETFEPIAFGIE